jgi:acetyltransferase-like isoleucine patch superfamily enzyme
MIAQTSYSVTTVPDYVTVGNYSSIAKEVIFMNEGDHRCVINRKCVYTTNWQQGPVNKITIGNDVWIGWGAKLRAGVTIGDGAIIGAWTIVAKDIPPFAVVVGNPPIIKRYRFTQEQIEKLLKIAWWNWDEQKVIDAKGDMQDVDEFIKKYEK